jgi:hypothetical protein
MTEPVTTPLRSERRNTTNSIANEAYPQIDGYVCVEELDGGVQQRSTCGDTCGVDDAVNPAVAGHGRPHAIGCRERIGKIISVEACFGSVAGQLSGKGLTG